MKKKRSLGVKILVTFMVIYSLLVLYCIVRNFGKAYNFSVSWIPGVIVYLISAYGIFRLKNWARILAFYFAIFSIIFCIYGVISTYVPYNAEARAYAFLVWASTIPYFIIGIPVIFFLILPRIKLQFKQ